MPHQQGVLRASSQSTGKKTSIFLRLTIAVLYVFLLCACPPVVAAKKSKFFNPMQYFSLMEKYAALKKEEKASKSFQAGFYSSTRTDKYFSADSKVAEKQWPCDDPMGLVADFSWSEKRHIWSFSKASTSGSPAATNATTKDERAAGTSPDDVERKVQLDTPNRCTNRKQFTSPDDISEVFQNKTLLFVGDSTVRNLAIMMMGMMCNPDHIFGCIQYIHWPFQEQNTWHGMNCGNETSSYRCGEIKFKTTILPDLSTENYYLTRRERNTEFWVKKKTPPLLTATFAGVTIMVLEAGCADSRNSISRALKYIHKWRSPPSDDSSGFVFPDFDLLITGGGLHCKLEDHTGTPWSQDAARVLRQLKSAGKKSIWLQATHCHWFSKYKRGSFCSCEDQLHYGHRVDAEMLKSKIPVSPTRFISKRSWAVFNNTLPINATERLLPCMFVDDLHPSLSCYGSMLQVHWNSFAMVLGIDVTRTSSRKRGSTWAAFRGGGGGGTTKGRGGGLGDSSPTMEQHRGAADNGSGAIGGGRGDPSPPTGSSGDANVAGRSRKGDAEATSLPTSAATSSSRKRRVEPSPSPPSSSSPIGQLSVGQNVRTTTPATVSADRPAAGGIDGNNNASNMQFLILLLCAAAFYGLWGRFVRW